jgi:hypothetical protein
MYGAECRRSRVGLGAVYGRKYVTCLHVGRGAHNMLNTGHGSLGGQGKGVVTMTTCLAHGLVVVTNIVRHEREALAIKRKKVTCLTIGGN